MPAKSLVTVLSLLLYWQPVSAAGSAADLQKCLGSRASASNFLTPASSQWTEATAPFNLRIAPKPLAVYTPASNSDISAALVCAEKANVKVSPLCGGHSFVSYGLGGRDGAFVIDMQKFRDVTLSSNGKVAKVGGGARIGDVINYLHDHGGYTFPHARGTHVGFAGSAIGGGFGIISRLTGTTLDNIVGVDMILPNGTEVHSSATQNPDILFATLGAASSFGVMTNLYVNTFPAPKWNATSYSYVLPPITSAQAVDIFSKLQDFVQNKAPQELSIRINFRFPKGTEIQGVYFGKPQDFEAVMQPMKAFLPTPIKPTIDIASFIDTEAAISGVLGTLNMSAPYSNHRNFYTQSMIANQPLSTATLSEYMKYLEANMMTNKQVRVGAFADFWASPKGKQTPTVRPAAFPHDNTFLLWRMDGVTPDVSVPWPADGVAFMQKFMQPLFKSQQTPRSFVNYRDSAYTTEEWESRYHSTSMTRLKAIKAQVDPHEVMSANPQSIPLP